MENIEIVNKLEIVLHAISDLQKCLREAEDACATATVELQKLQNQVEREGK